MARAEPGVRSLRAAVVHTGLSNAVYAGCQYGILMAIAKLGTPIDVGQFAIALAITAPVIAFSQMQLRQLQVTDASDRIAFSDYFVIRLTATVAAVLMIGITAIVSQYRGEVLLVIVFVGLAKAFESLSDIAYGRLQRFERMELIARSVSIRAALSLVMVALTMWQTRSLVAATATLALVAALIAIGYDLPTARGELDDRLLIWNMPAAANILRLALPLTIASGLTAVSGNLPRYFLEASHGSAAVGQFAVASAPLTLVALANAAVSQATLFRAASYFQGGDLASFSRLSRRLTVLQVMTGVASAALFSVWGAPLMSLLFTPEYTQSGPLAALMLAGIALGGLGAWGATVIFAGRRFGIQLWNTVAVIAAQIPLCYLLIPTHGVAGAAWSELARYMVSTVFLVGAGAAVYGTRRRQLASTLVGQTARSGAAP